MPITPDPDDRAPMAKALEWSTRLTTIGLEMAIPPGGGFWLDRYLGTMPLFVILGAVLGFVVGFYHILQIAQQEEAKRRDKR